MTADIERQLIVAAAWAAATPGYERSARTLRWIARHVASGELDLSRLAPPSPTEGAWAGLVRRLKVIGVDVVEVCGEEVET